MADFRDVASLIFEQMTQAGADWEMPWHGKQLVPINIRHGRAYTGINRLLLWARQKQAGYKSQHWGTFNQWRSVKRPVALGEKATTLVLPKLEKNAKGEDELVGFIRFWVFNGDQVLNNPEGHPRLFEDEPIHNPDVEDFVNRQRADIRHGYDIAAYYPAEDYICMPHKAAFIATRHSTNVQNYYATLLHELIHWTKHSTRCFRKPLSEDRQLSYAFEELVAELGAAFLCADFELEDIPRQDHAKYLNSWIQLFEEKPQAFWKAAALAQRSVDFLKRQESLEPEHDDSVPDWFTPEPVQTDMFAPKLLGTGRKRK